MSAFKPIALSEDKLALGHVLNDEVIANQKNTSGSVVIFKKFDEYSNNYEGSYNFTDLDKLINKKSFASFISFNRYPTEYIFQ